MAGYADAHLSLASVVSVNARSFLCRYFFNPRASCLFSIEFERSRLDIVREVKDAGQLGFPDGSRLLLPGFWIACRTFMSVQSLRKADAAKQVGKAGVTAQLVKN
jgi:hypothetical protein